MSKRSSEKSKVLNAIKDIRVYAEKHSIGISHTDVNNIHEIFKVYLDANVNPQCIYLKPSLRFLVDANYDKFKTVYSYVKKNR